MPLKFVLFGTFILFTACKPSVSDPPNILWINCDDLGQELSCYGNPDVRTPNMDRLAAEGIRYTKAYANAPVCSSTRSSQITGMYPSAINCLNHRTIEKLPLPDGVVPVMELFRDAGYFCTNGSAGNMKRKGKEDYNFQGKDFFDGTDWADRAEGQPFFAQVQIHEPHRDFVKDRQNPVDYLSVELPGCYPDHPLIRADWALYLESVQAADRYVGDILKRLEGEGLADNTIVILFGDHGRPHLRDKQWLYEGGLKIPLIIRWPGKIKPGEVKDDLISLVDVSASTLATAGINIPEYMHGKDIVGGDSRDYVLGFRQRCGDAVDDIRSITDGRYKLIWNRMPDRPYMQLSSYKKLQYPAFTLYRILNAKGELGTEHSQFMAESRPDYEFYDLESDPFELNNLSGQAEYLEIETWLREELKSRLSEIEKTMITEPQELIEKAMQGSEVYYKNSMEKKGIPADATDEMILEYWKNRLLKNLD